ncbi:MAG: aminotransferase class I/II-fold pyridoxal phosphate-dependent enzyme [Dehalococcoidia bacterium]|nr:aminotransferase class I/II-fold pyridoxal phosphate-dependent enzyme [Dehalococcoidia bacterium]
MIPIERERLGDWFIYGSEKGYDYSLASVGRTALRMRDVVPDVDLDQSLDWGGAYFGPILLKERIIATQEYRTARPEELFLTNGTYEANFAAMLGNVGAGDEVIVEEPAWTQIRVLAKSLGATVTVLPLRPEQGWKPDPDELRGLMSPRTKLVYINHPNNPTGSVLTDDEIRAIVEVVEPYGAYLLSDEIYRGLEWDRPLSATAIDNYERAIVTNSLTKTLGLCGLRLGWLATHDTAARERAFAVHRYAVMVTNVLGERLAAEALAPDRFPHLLEVGKAAGRRNRQIIDAWIRQSGMLSWVPPAGGFTSFARFEAPLSSWDLCRELLEHPYRTYLVPGICYHERFDDHVRIGFGGKSADQIPQALARIDEYRAQRLGRPALAGAATGA